MAFLDSFLRSPYAANTAIALGAVSIALLIAARFRLRQTTLTAPPMWGILAVGMLVWSCVYATTLPLQSSPAELREAISTWNYLRYAAAALIIAPTLAQLGAKSPQNGAWQFIVLTLVAVLLLPVLQGWAYGDEQPHVHGLFRWLLLAHVFVGVGNYAFTRYSAAAMLFGVGQLLLIAEYLPFESRPASPIREWFGLAAVSLSIVAAFVSARLRRAKPPSVDGLWTDFRDVFGAVWALRIAERLNASARSHGWPVEFAWSGVVGDLGSLDSALRHRIERELRSYLRRFASHDWIAARLPHEGDSLAERTAAASESPV